MILNNVSIYIRGNNNKFLIDENCLINNSIFWIENNDGTIHIGEKTTIEGAHFGLAENEKKIILGKDCMFSSGIFITTTDSHSILNDEKNRINYGGDVIIKNHVWVARNVQILKGATVNEGVIIGAGSIISKDLEANSLYVGVPARKIKSNISWRREKI